MKDSDFQQLKIVLCEHDKVWAYCVYHKDTIRPNLSISLLDKYYGRYKCWACPAEGWLSKEQMMILNLSSPITYTNDKKNLNTRWKDFNKSCYDNLQKYPLLKLGLAKQLNIATKSLDDWSVGYDNNVFTTPMLREDLVEYHREGSICGIQCRFPDGSKRCVTGSRLGLMYSYEYIERANNYIFICEGFSDGISVYDLGLPSIARPHCRYTNGIDGLFRDVLDVFDGETRIVVIGDADKVGVNGAMNLNKLLQKQGYESHVIIPPVGKDIREYILKRGKQQVKKELIRMI